MSVDSSETLRAFLGIDKQKGPKLVRTRGRKEEKRESQIMSKKEPTDNIKKRESTPFIAVAEALNKMQEDSSRKAKILYLEELFGEILQTRTEETSIEDITILCHLLTNTIRMPYKGDSDIGVGKEILNKAIATASGVSPSKVGEEFRKLGDIGKAAEALKSRQKTNFFSMVNGGDGKETLTVKGLYTTLLNMCKAKGSDVVKRKEGEICQLFMKASPLEIRFICQIILRSLRVGSALETVLVALATTISTVVLKRSRAKCVTKDEFAATLKAAYNTRPDLHFIVEQAIRDPGEMANVSLSIGTPVHPMLAKPLKSYKEMFEEVKINTVTFEYKYDGMRAQLHRSRNGVVKVFSRNLEDVTEQYPGMESLFGDKISTVDPIKFLNSIKDECEEPKAVSEGMKDKGEDKDGVTEVDDDPDACGTERDRQPKGTEPLDYSGYKGDGTIIIDSECVALGEKNEILPFQVLSTRSRKEKVEKADKGQTMLSFLDDSAVKVVKKKEGCSSTASVKQGEAKVSGGGTIKIGLFVFDVLYLNGVCVMDWPYVARRRLLREVISEIPGRLSYVNGGDCKSVEEMEELLDESVKSSCEGLMIKLLYGKESFYEPSCRSKRWQKLKKDYLEGVGDSIDMVPVGAWYGKGKRLGVYGAYLMAVYDPENDNFVVVSRTATGFSDAFLQEAYDRLRPGGLDKPPMGVVAGGDTPEIWFPPSEVWEIKAADLTLSSLSAAGRDQIGGDQGIGLRFPRLLKVRDDKEINEATTVTQLHDMFKNQPVVANRNTVDKDDSSDDDFL